jgi:dihydroflavonol-4-reductase
MLMLSFRYIVKLTEGSHMAQSGKVLVTGGSGYIASYVIAQLLSEGYEVATTIRNLGREPQVRETLAKIAPNQDKLSFYAADLLSDSGWAEAVAGRDYVIHVASPLPSVMPKSDDDLIIPAREGALRALRFARDAGVKRVVMTSSTAAITYGLSGPASKPFTEEDWTDETSPDASAYVRSKTVAEKAAWAFMKAEGGALELTTINPGAVLGPVLGTDYSASIQIVEKLMKGAFPACPRLGFPLVDVRDIADLHIRAMVAPAAAGQRFLGAGEFFWMEGIARILKDDLGLKARKVPTGKLPSFVMRLLANFDPIVKGIVFELDKERPISNAKARSVLGWTPRPERESIVATAESLIREGVVQA